MELITLLYILTGAAVGLAIGITGIGGGSLMTPLLLIFGFPPNIAVGTDLLYAAITKTGGVVFHQRKKNIDWKLVSHMAAGSIPAAILTSLTLKFMFSDPTQYNHLLTLSLGVILVLTSFALLFRQRLKNQSLQNQRIMSLAHQHSLMLTVITGFIIGVFVTLSSVGAGAIGAAVLLSLYPHLPSQKIVGVDIAHAVPLTFIAGLAHLWLGNVNLMLLVCLLTGSLPAIHLGTHLGNKMPNRILQPILASLLMVLGLKYVFY